MGVRGGAGATTIAVHLASFLARRQRQKTLILDQHPCLGHVALWFGMDGHSYSFYDLLQNISRLDQTLLKSYVAHHSSGTDVLTSPDLLRESVDIERDALGRAIRFVAGVYDFVVIDCPTGLEEPNLVTADGCDELLPRGDAGCSGAARPGALHRPATRAPTGVREVESSD